MYNGSNQCTAMNDYQRDFIDFVIATGALKFGEFELKSGRKSPYFFNAGVFDTGTRLARLGEYYARAIDHWAVPFDMLYGPAYKGIPLVTATAIALASQFTREVPFAFNRKEVKDHGEGGAIVGHVLQGRVIIIDDVISAGFSVAESITLIRQAGAEPTAVFVSMDRQEQSGGGRQSALEQIRGQYGLAVRSIITLDTLIEYLDGHDSLRNHLPAINIYRGHYGV